MFDDIWGFHDGVGFWIATPCRFVGRYYRFGGTCRLCLQPWSSQFFEWLCYLSDTHNHDLNSSSFSYDTKRAEIHRAGKGGKMRCWAVVFRGRCYTEQRLQSLAVCQPHLLCKLFCLPDTSSVFSPIGPVVGQPAVPPGNISFSCSQVPIILLVQPLTCWGREQQASQFLTPLQI
jgi:hypothetical protein